MSTLNELPNSEDLVDDNFIESQIFFQKIDNFKKSFNTSIKKEKRGKTLTEEFIEVISNNIQNNKISSNNPLYSHINTINTTLESFIENIEKEWGNFTISEELSKDFGDKLIFFVFGKVNAGKSSFSNLFSDISKLKSEISYLDKNGKVQTNKEENFKVGQTETTARIQWIALDSLLLVDSPGLHSVTKKNAELTKQYLNSADAIIWLTSSGSPGQVQELEELAKEMRKEKPILPIITKSDDYEEDWCDKTRKIVKTLKPKDIATRKEQEEDVKKRAEEVLTKLNSQAKLLHPISISSLCAKEGMMDESNIEKLFETLNKNILDEAIRYKSEKPKKLLIKYFELDIIEKVDKNLLPNIIQLKRELQKQKEILERKRSFLETTLISDVNLKISSLVQKHENSKNTQKLVDELNQYIVNKFNSEISKLLSQLFDNIQKTSISLDPNSVAEYKNIEFSYTVRGRERGLLKKIIELDFRDREDDYENTKVIGVDSSAVITSLVQSTSAEIKESIEDTFNKFHLSFNAILLTMSKMEKDIESFRTKIEVLKNEK